MASILEKSLAISTPGFDSLVNVIDTETQRIERNRALAQQRETQLELYDAQKEIDLANQKAMAEFESDLFLEGRKELADYDLNQKLKLNKQQHELEKEIRLEELLQEQFKDINDQKEQLNRRYENEYEDLIQLGLISAPAFQVQTTEAGLPFLVNKNESGQVELPEQYQQRADLLAHLGDFVNTINETTLLDSDEEIIVGDTKFLTRGEASDWVQKVRRAPMLDKIRYAEQVRDRKILPATEQRFPDLLKERSQSKEGLLQRERNARGLFSNLVSPFNEYRKEKGKTVKIQNDPIVILPDPVAKELNFTDSSGGIVKTLNLFQDNAGFLREVKQKLTKYGEDKEWLIRDPQSGQLGVDPNFKADNDVKKAFSQAYSTLNTYGQLMSLYTTGNTTWPDNDPYTAVLNKDFAVGEELQDISNMFIKSGVNSRTNSQPDPFSNFIGGTSLQQTIDSLNKN